MKRSFLISLSWVNRNGHGFMNYCCHFENRGFRQSDIKEIEKHCEELLFNVHGDTTRAVILHVSELEAEE